MDPSKIHFKMGDMVLLGSHTPKDIFDSKYKQSSGFVRKFQTRLMMFKMIKAKLRVSFQHLQLLQPTEHMLTNLPHLNSFG